MRKILMSALLAFFMAGAVAAEAPVDPDFQALARKVEQVGQVGEKNGPAEELFDVDMLMKRMRGDGLGEDSQFLKGFAAGIKKKLTIEQMVASWGGRDAVKFLRFRTDGEPRALFRTYDSGGLNYVELIFAKDSNGKARIVDVYSYIQGETFSTAMRTTYQSIMKGTNPSLFQKTFNNGPDVLSALSRGREMAELYQAQNYSAAMDIYKSLPKEVRLMKSIQLIHIMIARQLSDLHCMEALQQFERTFPNDPSLMLVKMDAFFLQRKFDEGLKNLDALEKAIGGDPLLNIYRVNYLLLAGRASDALAIAQKAVVDFPEMVEANMAVLRAQIALKDFPGGIKTAALFKSKFGWDDTQISEDPEYKDFLSSKEYKDWKATLK